jgi:putative restriction endonuclease
MLTENGYNHILEILHIPLAEKEVLPIKSYEVQKIVKKIYEHERPINYNPFENKKNVTITQETKLRNRAFKQVVREAYEYKCAVCGMKICSPNTMQWEVEAAHIVPHRANGKDDILNGIALCRLHHWAFDVGWFTLENNLRIITSRKIRDLSADNGHLGDFDFIGHLSKEELMISLPKDQSIYPHPTAIKWHRDNIFCP